jgi:putative NADH-flavin reductase
MKLVIFGATGTVGKSGGSASFRTGTYRHRLCPQFDQARYSTSSTQLRPRRCDGCRSSRTAIQGKDAVVCVLGAGKKLKSTIRSEGTQQIIQAMQRSGVRRLICLSTLGAGESWSNLNFYWKYVMFGFILRQVFADHQRQEALVKNSNLDWTIVRPGALTDGPHTGQYRHSFPSSDRNITLQISRADVADFILKQLSDQSSLYQSPSLSY